MTDEPDRVARLTRAADLLQQALSIVDADNEYIAAARLEEVLTLVRSRIETLRGCKG